MYRNKFNVYNVDGEVFAIRVKYPEVFGIHLTGDDPTTEYGFSNAAMNMTDPLDPLRYWLYDYEWAIIDTGPKLYILADDAKLVLENYEIPYANSKLHDRII